MCVYLFCDDDGDDVVVLFVIFVHPKKKYITSKYFLCVDWSFSSQIKIIIIKKKRTKKMNNRQKVPHKKKRNERSVLHDFIYSL